jgi:hypothetical protein
MITTPWHLQNSGIFISNVLTFGRKIFENLFLNGLYYSTLSGTIDTKLKKC